VCAEIERLMPMGRLGDCESEIAGCLLGLVSDNGRYITGQTIFVDGGTWLLHNLETEHSVGTNIHVGRQQDTKGH
jgi:enoyl-[acyl-carrier-protein] reductase (NADH)